MARKKKSYRISSVSSVEHFSRIDSISRVSNYSTKERTEKMMQIAEAERDRLENMAAIKMFNYDGDESFEELLEKAKAEYDNPAFILDIGNHEEDTGVNVDIGGRK